MSMKKLVIVLALASASVLAIGTMAVRAGGGSVAAAAVPAVPEADTRTRAVANAAIAFLNTLGAEQRAKALFGFAPQKTANIARFARTGAQDGAGGVGPSGAGGARPPRPDGQFGPPPGGGKGQGNGPGMGPDAGFVGERYGEAVWSNYPVSDVPRPGLQLGSLNARQRAAAMYLLEVLLSPQGYQKVLDIMGSDQALSDQGQPYASGRDVYTIALFGTPCASTPWMVQFGEIGRAHV